MKTTRRIVLLIAVCMPLISGCKQPSDALDVLIINGTVVDGTGGKPQALSLGIRGDVVAYIGPSTSLPAKRIVDASSLIVSPGFIDPHTHAGKDLLSPDKSANLAYLYQGVTTVIIGNDGGGNPDIDALQNQLSVNGIGTNVGLLTGHGALRRRAMGSDNRAPTADELAEMKRVLGKAMKSGSLGLSTGLFYAPGSFAETDEIIELARVVADYGGVHDSHIRDESDYSIGLVNAISEIIEISRQSGVAGHISHIKALGPAVWGQSRDVIERIRSARAEGLAISANQYPWLASGTHLASALVPRSVMDGGRDAMLLRLQDAAILEEIRPRMQANLERRGGPDALLITSESKWQGKTLAEVSKLMSKTPVDSAVAIILGGDPSVASFVMQEEDVERFMVQPWVVTGSDGSPGHPRKYASFPEKYQMYVVRRSLLTLTEFVRQSSALTAEIFNLCDRGRLLPGMQADIAVWSSSEFEPAADYQHPERLARGVQYLLVNGEFVIDEGRLTDDRSGEVLLRHSCIPDAETGALNNL